MKKHFGGIRTLGIIIILALVIVVLAIVVSSRTKDTEEPDASLNSSARISFTQDEEGNVVPVIDRNPDDEEDEEAFKGEVLAGSTTPLVTFTQADYERALAEGKDIGLFFFADWCSTCRRELRDAVIPAFNELAVDNFIGFHVNIEDRNTSDFEEDLQKQFQVLGRHVKVFISGGDDSDFQKTAPENWTTQQYLDRITSLNS
jgi:Thiol-disulfide isomerase and thioredoxins